MESAIAESVTTGRNADSVSVQVGNDGGDGAATMEKVDNEIVNSIAGLTESAKPTSWDETVVTAAQKPPESFVVPIDDVTDTRHKIQKISNTYAAKKTVAQGMMDIALITANANQLRYIIEFNSESRTFYLTVILIILSLLLQVAVGVSLIFKGRFDLRGQGKSLHARRINNYVVVAVFLVTIINVFIASFTITGTNSSLAPQPVPQLG